SGGSCSRSRTNRVLPRFPPARIVPALADEGVYLASESSFYRVLARARAMPPSWSSQNTAGDAAADDARSVRAERGVVLGSDVLARGGRWALVLPVRDHRSVQPQDRSLGGSRQRRRSRSCSAAAQASGVGRRAARVAAQAGAARR